MNRAQDFIRRAVELSGEYMRAGLGGPFGAIVVRGEEILAEGTNRVTSTIDPTAHAEVVAIREACRRLGSFSLAGCELYTSCEPCPMCLGAIYWARLDRVYYANTRADAAAIGFDDDAIYQSSLLIQGQPALHHLPSPRGSVFREWMDSRINFAINAMAEAPR
jgi:tRNA(Arg) A34 adenosine deaminase TadA